MKPLKAIRLFPCLQCDSPVPYERSSRFCSDACANLFEKEHHLRCLFCGDWKFLKLSSQDQIVCLECRKALDDHCTCCRAGDASYLLDFYQQRYVHLLGMTEWDEDDLSDLVFGLRTSIKKSLKEKHQFEARLQWLNFRKNTHTCEEF